MTTFRVDWNGFYRDSKGVVRPLIGDTAKHAVLGWWGESPIHNGLLKKGLLELSDRNYSTSSTTRSPLENHCVLA